MIDQRVREARQAQHKATAANLAAKRARAERNRLIRELRTEDPKQWSFGALAVQIGCSKGLIVRIMEDE